MDRVVGAIANIGSIARRHCTLILAFSFPRAGAAFSIWNAIEARCSRSCSVVESPMIERRKVAKLTSFLYIFHFALFLE